MAKDDFDVICYKVLSYLYACLKAGVQPSFEQAREFAGCNDVYWDAVWADLLKSGYVSADNIGTCGGHIYRNIRITFEGSVFLDENDRMSKVGKFLGKAFPAVIESAVAVTTAM